MTGAGSGIGRATALAFAARGARLLCVDVDTETAGETASSCARLGMAAHGLGCDVADRRAVAELAGVVAADHGTLDVLVNNAGVGMTGRFAESTVDDWEWIRSVNLDGVVYCCKAFTPPMLARGAGHVVNVSSGFAYAVRATEPDYVTTKAAVLALSRCLRADWARQGVGVSAICPGLIDTPIVGRARYLGSRDDPAFRARLERLYRRGHPPELVARAVVDAVRRNRAVVPVGWEARLVWQARRVMPVALEGLLGRLDLP